MILSLNSILSINLNENINRFAYLSEYLYENIIENFDNTSTVPTATPSRCEDSPDAKSSTPNRRDSQVDRLMHQAIQKRLETMSPQELATFYNK